MQQPIPERGTDVTVVSPVYNELDNVVQLVDELEAVFGPLPYRLTVLLVDDGSGPPTMEILDRLAHERERVIVLHLSRNFGHQAALTAGLDAAQGDAVITMDADLQHPVAVIPELLARWAAGADVVQTIRRGRQPGLLKRLASWAYYRIMSWASPTPIVPGAADFRLYDKQVVSVLRTMTERARFLRGMSVWVGFTSAQVPFEVAPRRAGVTKYSWPKMVRLGLDGLVSLSSLPLYAAFHLGVLVSLLSLAYLVYVLGVYFLTDTAVAGWSSLMVVVLFLSGVQILLMGVLGLYVGKIYDEVRGRPSYIVARRSGPRT